MKIRSLENAGVFDNWLCLQSPSSFPRNLIYFPYVVLRIFFARTVSRPRIYVARERYLEIRISPVNLIRSYHILVLDSNSMLFMWNRKRSDILLSSLWLKIFLMSAETFTQINYKQKIININMYHVLIFFLICHE